MPTSDRDYGVPSVGRYFVVCRSDDRDYTLATRGHFATKLGAIVYASTIDPCRKARVVKVVWGIGG